MKTEREWVAKGTRNPSIEESIAVGGAFRTLNEDGSVSVRYFDDTNGSWWIPRAPDDDGTDLATVPNDSFSHWLRESFTPLGAVELGEVIEPDSHVTCDEDCHTRKQMIVELQSDLELKDRTLDGLCARHAEVTEELGQLRDRRTEALRNLEVQRGENLRLERERGAEAEALRVAFEALLHGLEDDSVPADMVQEVLDRIDASNSLEFLEREGMAGRVIDVDAAVPNARVSTRGELLCEVRDLLVSIAGWRRGSIGSIESHYVGQIGRPRVDGLLQGVNAAIANDAETERCMRCGGPADPFVTLDEGDGIVRTICEVCSALLTNADEKTHSAMDALGQANGALSDISTIVTSCVGADDPSRVHAIAEAVHGRILASASAVWDEPSWYRHHWEEEQFRRYLAGDIKACASEISSSELARSYWSVLPPKARTRQHCPGCDGTGFDQSVKHDGPERYSCTVCQPTDNGAAKEEKPCAETGRGDNK